MGEIPANETKGGSVEPVRPSFFRALRRPLVLPGWIAFVVCALLIVQFFVFALLAVRQKNATYDENFHVLGAYSSLRLHDYRVDPDNFTLWEYWAAIPQRTDDIKIDYSSPLWSDLLTNNMNKRDDFAAWTLYFTPGNDVDAILMRSRAMMLIVGCGLAAMIARWSYELGGSIAAIFATALFTFDPDFLGHSPLVKNDVATALVIVLAAYGAWRAGKRATYLNIVGLALACGAMANVKASAIVVGPILLGWLAVRAIGFGDWSFIHRTLHTRIQRIGAVAITGAICAVVSYAMIWACYGFRFRGTPDSSQPISIQTYVDSDRLTSYVMAHDKLMPPNTSEADWPAAGSARFLVWLEHHRVFPQAWLCGILYAAAELRFRSMFLCGQISIYGWWYYFIYASAFKLPIATLAAIAIAMSLAVWQCVKLFRRRLIAPSLDWLWPGMCIIGTALIFFMLASASHVDLGIRHIFGVYALLYITLGWMAGSVWRSLGWEARSVSLILLLLLAIESIGGYPDYIAFFNRAAGSSRGGLNLLSDANLDWGQDLKTLAKWQQAHPNERLYLCYLGLADPNYYGIRYIGVITGYRFHNDEPGYFGPGVLAINVISLQGTFSSAQFRASVNEVRKKPPFDVLGGTIYLYHVK